MGRPPSDPPPAYTLTDAITAAEHIQRLRAEGRDGDLDFFPAPVQDDDDVEQALRYTETHRSVPISILAAELPHRAVLATYIRQRDTAAHDRHDLAILETGQATHTPARVYGRAMGLPTRSAASMRRDRLRRRLRDHYDTTPAGGRSDREQNDRVDAWLRTNRGELRAVAEHLADYREALLSLAEQSNRTELREALDAAGKTLSPRPSSALAGAIAYAAFHLDAEKTTDPVLRDVITRAHQLRQQFDTVRTNT